MSNNKYAQKVVQVVVYGKPLSSKFPVLNEQAGRARGSGFFVRFGNEKIPRYILTAAHVVEDGFPENGVKVILPLSGQQEIPVQVRVIIPEMDLAVLEIDPRGHEKFIDAFPIGNDHNLEFAADKPLLVLGYPLGMDQLKVLRCNFSGRQDIGIQTDCAINKGNSGGPLVYNNKIVGWVSTGISPTMANNMSFSVPINQFHAMKNAIVQKLKDPQSNTPVLHAPHTGVVYHNNSLANTTGDCQGVVIQFISQYSALNGVANIGDKLCAVEFGGHKYNLDARGEVSVPWYFAKLPFSQIAGEIPYGDPVTFYLWDSQTGRSKTHKAPLTVPNRGGYLFQSLRYEPIEYEMFAGLMIMPLRANHMTDFPHLRNALSLSEREQDWLLITHITPGSEIYEIGSINPGDLLIKVNDQNVKTLADLKKALKKPFLTPQGKRGIKFETRDHVSVVLDLQNVLQNEKMYSQQSGTELSEVVSQLQQ
jgi:S1-C subfamily serine protease